MESLVQSKISDCDDTKNNENIAVNEVIEVESSDEESGLVEIETVHSEDLFDFCVDQIMNASTHEERQDAHDLLVDNFCEMSLYELDLDVNFDKGNQSPSTSQAGSSSQLSQNLTRTNRKCSQQQLDKHRKYWQQLIKDYPAKYQKALQRMRTYHKQRREQMTEHEKKAYRQRKCEANRKYRNKLSTEKKRQMSQKGYQQQKLSGLNKFVCKFPGCSKSFVYDKELIKHERVHLDIKPFSCTWPDCQYTSKTCGSVVRHVRIRHFKLRQTKQQQHLNIIDDRNPNEYVRVNNELVTRRLD